MAQTTKKMRQIIADIGDRNVRVNPEIFDRVKKYCDENGMKIGWFYTQSAKLYLEQLKELVKQ
jgi:hypothetical protein